MTKPVVVAATLNQLSVDAQSYMVTSFIEALLVDDVS